MVTFAILGLMFNKWVLCMNRKNIKMQALKMLENNVWNIWKPILVIVFILIIFEILFSYINFDSELAESIVYLILFSLITSQLFVGFSFYMLNLIRGNNFAISNFFCFYKSFITIFIINLIVQIFFMFGLFFFIVPAVIVMLCYSFVNYVFADGEKDVIDALRSSRELISGYKFKYLKFILSFTGWFLVVLCTFGTAVIFVLPYISLSNALYYDKLLSIKE